MPGDIGVFIEGAREVDLRFEQLPQSIHSRLYAQIVGIIARLEGEVEGVVPRRTGKLASEIKSDVRQGPDFITGRVGVTGEYAKAGALEYGAHRPTKVKTHSMRLDHVFGNRMRSPETVIVAAYTRTPNIAEHRFMRGTFERSEAAIKEELSQAVSEALAEGA